MQPHRLAQNKRGSVAGCGGQQGRAMLTMEGGAESPVVLSGRLDATQAAAAQAYLDRLHGVVTLDCSDLQYLSSAGLGVFLKTHKRLLGAVRRSTATSRTSSAIRASTRFSRSNPVADALANLCRRRVYFRRGR